MNRFITGFTVVFLAITVFAASNEWDGKNGGYNGAFGTTNGLPDWSTATSIYTIAPDNPGNLGYLRMLNLQSTTITVTNSFSGFLEFKNGPGAVTNRVVSLDEDVVVTGAVPATGLNASKRAISVEIPAPPVGTKSGALILDEGTYIGGTGSQGAFASGLALFEINGSKIAGGKGSSIAADKTGTVSSGGAGIFMNNVDLLKINSRQLEADAIRGGDGGDDLFSNSTLPMTSKGGDAITMFLFNKAAVLENGLVVGGSGGRLVSTATTSFDLPGGNGITVSSGALTLKDGIVRGGSGGNAKLNSTSSASKSVGGYAAYLSGANVLDSKLGSVELVGGAGGQVEATAKANSLDVSGGHGLVVTNVNKTIVATGAEISGGAGGTLKSVGSTAVVAKGGDAVRLRGTGAGSLTKMQINGGSYTGGQGGIFTDASGTAVVDAGRALFSDNGATLLIGGNATFTGGSAGVVNGVAGVQGVALEIQNANLTITNGTFVGRKGLLSTSTGAGSSITILDGSFGNAEFSGNNAIRVNGGTFNELLLSGAGVNTAVLAGSNVDVATLAFEGSGANTVNTTNSGLTHVRFSGSANNTLNIFNNGAVIDNLEQSGSTANVNFNGSQAIDKIAISGGSMNISGTDLVVMGGNSYLLGGSTAGLNISQALQVQDKGILNVGLGKVVAQKFTASEGSELTTGFASDGAGGVKTGVIEGEEMVFEDVASWTLASDGTATNTAAFAKGFLLASSTTSNMTSSALDSTKFKFSEGSNPNWTLGINGFTNKFENLAMNLYATYGDLNYEKVFEDYKDLVVVMQDLDKFLNDPNNPNSSLLKDYISTNWTDAAAAATDFSEGFTRTPEMANALVGLQSVFADQIKDRTRSYLRLENWGSKGVSPTGAAGPSDWYGNTVQWAQDHFPVWDAQGASRSFSDNAPELPLKGDPAGVDKPYHTGRKDSDYDTAVDYVNDLLPSSPGEMIDVPSSYQAWGRGYYADLDQDSTGSFAGADYHSGYSATVAGGIVGIDKRLDNMMYGIGGGFASTRLSGKGGNDGKANTFHGVGYFSSMLGNFYLDANVNLAYNDVKTDGINSMGYEAEYDANTAGFYLGGGYGMSAFKDTLLLTPEASVLMSYYNRSGYTEKSSIGFPDKTYDSYDQLSPLSSIGATLSMIKQIESFASEMEFQPELRAHWLHQFNAEMDNETYSMAGIPGGGQTIGVALQAREEDLFKIGAGLRFSRWNSDLTELGVDIDGVLSSSYEALIVSAKIMHRF